MFAILSLLLGVVKVSVGSIEVGGSSDSRQITGQISKAADEVGLVR
jgi:hypothetical protein